MDGPFLIQSADDSLTGAFIELPGSNMFFEDIDPVVGDSVVINGERFVHMRVLVGTSLPDAGAFLDSGVFDGTLFDLQDSYGNPLGMYRLDATTRTWMRRDAGGLTLETVDFATGLPLTILVNKIIAPLWAVTDNLDGSVTLEASG